MVTTSIYTRRKTAQDSDISTGYDVPGRYDVPGTVGYGVKNHAQGTAPRALEFIFIFWRALFSQAPKSQNLAPKRQRTAPKWKPRALRRHHARIRPS
eukprot:scaffold627240_cov35-Attheya_sp.AAC.1